MLRWWWAAGPAAILIAVTALHIYWLHQLHMSQAHERESYLQRATFLFAAEMDHRLSLVQTQFQEADGDAQHLQATWRDLEQPELVEAIWLIDPSNRTTATQLSRDSQVNQPIDDTLHAWLFGSGPLAGLPPLLFSDEASEGIMVAVIWNPDYFRETFVPGCLSQASPTTSDLRYNIIQPATGESLMGAADLVADSSSHFYPQSRIASPWRTSDTKSWANPRFSLETGALHFESHGVLRLETGLAAGRLSAIEQRQLLRDGLPALMSFVFLTLAFAAFYIYLRRAQNLAHQQAAMMAAFSHELRTPLTTIGIAGENLADATIQDENKIRSYGRLITQESNRLGTMVMQVLQYSKLFSMRDQTNGAQANVTECLDKVTRELTLLLEDKHCQVHSEFRQSSPMAAIEPEALQTILRNLLSNAIKFGGNEPTVEIVVEPAVWHRRAGLNIHVTDHGFGIPKREGRRIYDQFFRGDRASKDQIQGSGLGLSLVRKLVQTAGGRVYHQSQEDMGTTFTVWLPNPREQTA